MRKLDPDDPRPPYLQVADNLRTSIDAGDYPPGAKLPSYESLAEEFGVSMGVVKRAMTQLRADRVVVSRQGQGVYVRSDRGEEAAVAPTLSALQADMTDMSARLAAVERRLAKLE